MTHDHRTVNRSGWRILGERGCEWTRPFGPKQFERARKLLDPESWIPWGEIKTVLCLAGGGGQQSALFASLGCRVTVLDLSPEQLERDRVVARQHGFSIETVEGEMEDLRRLHKREFDLVYQPISAVYTPDVRKVYEEVRDVLRREGLYWVTHWNPVYVQMPEGCEWDGSAYRLAHPQTAHRVPVPQTSWLVDGERVSTTTWLYIHPLGDLIGGIIEAGFTILRFSEETHGDLTAEPASARHLAAYVPPSFTLFARKIDPRLG